MYTDSMRRCVELNKISAVMDEKASRMLSKRPIQGDLVVYVYSAATHAHQLRMG
jgi:hypothetical protein